MPEKYKEALFEHERSRTPGFLDEVHLEEVVKRKAQKRAELNTAHPTWTARHINEEVYACEDELKLLHKGMQ